MISGLDLTQLKRMIVRPTLTAIGLSGDTAVNMLTGTALAESSCAYLAQVGGGPALGLWQMEPATHNDCWTNFLDGAENARFAEAVRPLMSGEDRLVQLVSNLRYACAMARVKFYRAPEPLPGADDAVGLATYWKLHYNTTLGAGSVNATHVRIFQQAISA